VLKLIWISNLSLDSFDNIYSRYTYYYTIEKANKMTDTDSFNLGLKILVTFDFKNIIQYRCK